jgi:hypothetical protein
MLFTSMCCPLRTSRYGACHARRRWDGPCERVAFRVRTCMPSNADRRQPPSTAAPLVTLRLRHRTARHARGPVETAKHQRTHARMPTAWAACAGTPLPHGWYYARLGTSTVAVTADDLAGAFRRETCLETREEAPYQSRCFLNTILHGITRATTLGPSIAVSAPRVGFVPHLQFFLIPSWAWSPTLVRHRLKYILQITSSPMLVTKVPHATSGPFVVWNLPRRVEMSRAQLGSDTEKHLEAPQDGNPLWR